MRNDLQIVVAPAVASSPSSIREGKVFFAYRGPLFGKRGRKYILLKMNSEDVDGMERTLLATQNELLAASAMIYRMARTNDDYIAAAYFKRCAQSPENAEVACTEGEEKS